MEVGFGSTCGGIGTSLNSLPTVLAPVSVLNIPKSQKFHLEAGAASDSDDDVLTYAMHT